MLLRNSKGQTFSPQRTRKFSAKTLAPVKITTQLHQKKRFNLNDSNSVREVNLSLIVKTTRESLGRGTFGECFLAWYRGIKVVVKEMRRRNDTPKESERCKREVLHEANVLHCLGDHVGLPFVLGVCTQQQPYSLVLQFYGSGEDSSTLYKAIKQRKLN